MDCLLFSLCLNLIFYRKLDLYSSLKSCAINLCGCSDSGFVNKVEFLSLFLCRSIEFVLNALNFCIWNGCKMRTNKKVISFNFAKQILLLMLPPIRWVRLNVLERGIQTIALFLRLNVTSIISYACMDMNAFKRRAHMTSNAAKFHSQW